MYRKAICYPNEMQAIFAEKAIWIVETGIITRTKPGWEKGREILEWLGSCGGYCDCDILANVEEPFDQYSCILKGYIKIGG